MRGTDAWRFDPGKTVIGMGHRRFGLVRSLFEGRRRSAVYLKRRGWERPAVPWQLLKQVKREAFGERR